MLNEVTQQSREETDRDRHAEPHPDPGGHPSATQGRCGHVRLSVAKVRSPKVATDRSVRPTSALTVVAQSTPTEAQRNHGPIVVFDSSRTQRASTPVVAELNSAIQLPP